MEKGVGREGEKRERRQVERNGGWERGTKAHRAIGATESTGVRIWARDLGSGDLVRTSHFCSTQDESQMGVFLGVRCHPRTIDKNLRRRNHLK